MSPLPPDSFEEQMAQLADSYAEAWRFETDGATIIGTVVGFSEWDAGWGPYPILTLRLADGSERALHAQREVLQRELAAVRPQIGERIGVKWLGQPDGKSYHRFQVRVDRPEGTTADWSRYVPGVEEPPPRPVASTAPPAGDPGPEPGSRWGGDDDIPF